MGYRVTAPVVQARTEAGGYVHVYQGGFLPDDPDAEQLEQLIASEMVEEADEPAPDDEPKPARKRGK